MKSFLNKHHRIIGIIGGVISLLVAVLYLVITPDEALSAGGFQKIILIYGHSVCWILLSGASFLWATLKKNKWSKILAYTALPTYVIFIATLLITKSY